MQKKRSRKKAITGSNEEDDTKEKETKESVEEQDDKDEFEIGRKPRKMQLLFISK